MREGGQAVTRNAGGRMRGRCGAEIPFPEKPYPGIITDFLQKARERTPRGFQKNASTVACVLGIPGAGILNFAPDPSLARSQERSTRGLLTNQYQRRGCAQCGSAWKKSMPRRHHRLEAGRGRSGASNNYVTQDDKMRQPQHFSDFQRAVSRSRLEPYLNHSPNGDWAQAFGTYLWNLALCESLYPTLQGIEVALRNGIHDAAIAEFGDEFWFKSQLIGYERKQIGEIEKKLAQSKTPATPGRFISECNFGFWENLFNGQYEHILWRRMLRATFPNAPRHLRRRRGIRVRLDHIRRLRNRVFHHEPIWHLPDLQEQHQQILETIG